MKRATLFLLVNFFLNSPALAITMDTPRAGTTSNSNQFEIYHPTAPVFGTMFAEFDNARVTDLGNRSDSIPGLLTIPTGWGNVSATPLPDTLALFAAGLLGMAIIWRQVYSRQTRFT